MVESFAWRELSRKGIERAVLEWPKMPALMSYPLPIRRTEPCLFRLGRRVGWVDLPRIKAHAGSAGVAGRTGGAPSSLPANSWPKQSHHSVTLPARDQQLGAIKSPVNAPIKRINSLLIYAGGFGFKSPAVGFESKNE